MNVDAMREESRRALTVGAVALIVFGLVLLFRAGTNRTTTSDALVIESSQLSDNAVKAAHTALARDQVDDVVVLLPPGLPVSIRRTDNFHVADGTELADGKSKKAVARVLDGRIIDSETDKTTGLTRIDIEHDENAPNLRLLALAVLCPAAVAGALALNASRQRAAIPDQGDERPVLRPAPATTGALPYDRPHQARRPPPPDRPHGRDPTPVAPGSPPAATNPGAGAPVAAPPRRRSAAPPRARTQFDADGGYVELPGGVIVWGEQVADEPSPWLLPGEPVTVVAGRERAAGCLVERRADATDPTGERR